MKLKLQGVFKLKKIIIVFIIIIIFTLPVEGFWRIEETLSKGDNNPEVFLLQLLLDNEGFEQEITGVFDKQTKLNIQKYQYQRGLIADRFVNKELLNTLLTNNEFNNYSFDVKDILFLAKVIHGEARGETFLGQIAVGAVILNRVQHYKFPNSIISVIFQPRQFCAVYDGQAHNPPSKKALKAALLAIYGYDPTNGALYFYNPIIASDVDWIFYKKPTITIQNHVFLK